MKRIWQIVKRIIISAFVLYGYNLIATRFNLVIPINYITIGAVSVLGFPMLFVLVLLKVLVF
ncbi:MAG TPA: pro-sigmaK processing inhibitor BofA family protein [Candidatus Onthousia faecavium]|nr:pro-sigmaK processing inhibitor BofA family protein [Candidatus Onthousia faecavium]